MSFGVAVYSLVALCPNHRATVPDNFCQSLLRRGPDQEQLGCDRSGLKWQWQSSAGKLMQHLLVLCIAFLTAPINSLLEQVLQKFTPILSKKNLYLSAKKKVILSPTIKLKIWISVKQRSLWRGGKKTVGWPLYCWCSCSFFLSLMHLKGEIRSCKNAAL